jgi:hypothetical protein
VGDAAIAGPIADGRLLPVLIVDTRQHQDLAELIRVHEHLPPGDVISQWASSLDNDDHILLILKFTHPMEVNALLRFSIEHQAILVESILSGGALYLQSGLPGDRLITNLDAARILVEVPDSGFRPHWERLLLKRLTAVMARRMGTTRRRARGPAQAVVIELRKLVRLRLTPR